MGKKKIYKDDGVTEDFDAEAKELDEAAAGGLVSGEEDAGKDKADALGVAAPSADEAPQGDAAPAESAPEAAPEAAKEEPDAFGELHGDVSALADHLESATLDALKEAGNKLTPAVAKLHGLEDKFHEFGDEVKNRIAHVKTKVVEAMGALELIFRRGK